MKKRIHIALCAFALSFASYTTNAQEQISEIFKAGVGDVGYLANGYLKPAGVGFATGLGSNWYNTAATHSLLGFDLTFGTSISMVPISDQTFSLTGLTTLSPKTGEIPTFGGSGDGTTLKLLQPNMIDVNGVQIPNPKAGQTITTLTTPKGMTKYIPSANLQLGIGLPFGTDITFRYTPDLNVKGMNVGLWGVGVKHDIKQWIPVVKMLPFDASVMVAYSKFKLNYAFESQLRYTQLGDPSMVKAPAADLSANQGFGIDADALMANFILSKKFLIFTPYVGAGITKTNFNVNFDGVFPLLGAPITTPGADFGKLTVQYLDSEKLPNVSYSETMLGTTVGFRLKFLMVVAMHAQYTFQKYPTASLGFGINFR